MAGKRSESCVYCGCNGTCFLRTIIPAPRLGISFLDSTNSSRPRGSVHCYACVRRLSFRGGGGGRLVVAKKGDSSYLGHQNKAVGLVCPPMGFDVEDMAHVYVVAASILRSLDSRALMHLMGAVGGREVYGQFRLVLSSRHTDGQICTHCPVRLQCGADTYADATEERYGRVRLFGNKNKGPLHSPELVYRRWET
ncbi:hypothetical protein GGTG_00796 [Gaeumannomyces tritici R3-111a-1]|uniref:Uncharacterized protein n=1 Tax=Gaeumannomyces tritici (strain R3-111a-1) TaxID=644352 RepID=J3NHQ9_GAET3|nr:hypothetical protein GGTG_00796 [Gaeumannomyces tritici R3-111a-1]EJT80802.1 hypothetical protein GGTG_00796 [Gaeumannomyces tritici R3-111a-1]